MALKVDSNKTGAGVPIARIDAGLLLARLEKCILSGENLSQARGLLQKEPIRQSLSVQDQLRWAELAQMAGEAVTARQVLEHINHAQPDCLEAWRKHLELLAIIGPAEKFAAVLAQARPHIDEKSHAQWLGRVNQPLLKEEKDLRAAVLPFEQHHRRQAVLQRFLTLFSGRPDCFARQWADRKAEKQGYVPERRPMSTADLEEHLSGRKTYGIYLMQADGRIQTAVIDADLAKALRNRPLDAQARTLVRREAYYLVQRVKELSQAIGAAPVAEFSGSKGYHFWYFFETPIACAPVRAALAGLVKQIAPDLTAFSLEVFPKQDQPSGKGFGNLVKLPLGLHRVTGKRSYFIGCADHSVDAQLDYLFSIRYVDGQKMLQHSHTQASAEVVPHPRWRQWAETYPELYCLQNACAPLAQVMSLCIESGRLSLREEKILYQTIGFLPDGKRLLHYLMAKAPEYNPHLVDYRLSRLRGTPLGCRRIHDLLRFTGPMCRFNGSAGYPHPLLHLENWREPTPAPAEKAAGLGDALERLKTAILQVEGFLK